MSITYLKLFEIKEDSHENEKLYHRFIGRYRAHFTIQLRRTEWPGPEADIRG
jgi:hypothetical protein